jgi:hypothetical protein
MGNARAIREASSIKRPTNSVLRAACCVLRAED